MKKPNDLMIKTLKMIKESPDSFHMGDWGRKYPSCGTTMCFAGWAVHANGDTLIWDNDERYDSTTDRLEVIPDSATAVRCLDKHGVMHDIDIRAEELLGLSSDSHFYRSYGNFDQLVQGLADDGWDFSEVNWDE